jgi:pyruvyltransferase
MKIKVFYYDGVKNAGDMLTTPILKHFGYEAVLTGRNNKGKLLGVGSIMRALRAGDTVWGAGCILKHEVNGKGCRFLAVRGPKTKELIKNANVPAIYGDPGLLLPLIYNPDIKVTHEVGIVPHYVDKQTAYSKYAIDSKYNKFIDIQADWQTVVKEIKSCKKIISSSLHGIVIAEAYGIPAEWEVLSDKLIGGEFKFQDYFLGTGRDSQRPDTPLPAIPDIREIQDRLIKALEGYNA